MAQKSGAGKKPGRAVGEQSKENPGRKEGTEYAELVKTLSRIVGNENVHTDDAVCTAYASYAGTPRVVVIPRNMKEMRLVLEACRNARVPVDTVWSKVVEKDVLLVEGVVVDTRMLARSYPSSVLTDYTHYGEPPVTYRQWGVR
jgi:hypothetical protein